MLVNLQIKEVILGLALADALGLPFESQPRKGLRVDLVRKMLPSKDHPAGTWSANTSMTLATMDSMARMDGVDFDDLMHSFLHWMNDGLFTPTGHAFGIGRNTEAALKRYHRNIPALQAGGNNEMDNGNGALLRMAPLALYIYARHGTDFTKNDVSLVHNVCALTHRHIRSKVSCMLYVAIILNLMAGLDSEHAVSEAMKHCRSFYLDLSRYSSELWNFSPFFQTTIFAQRTSDEIASTGYVVDTLRAAVWCLLNTTDYEECVEHAIRLGGDASSIGAVAGTLSGARYGLDRLPESWLKTFQRRSYIEEVCDSFGRNLTRMVF